jgi:hypothetical protein
VCVRTRRTRARVYCRCRKRTRLIIMRPERTTRTPHLLTYTVGRVRFLTPPETKAVLTDYQTSLGWCAMNWEK